jgi:hypothetical protein
MKLPASGYFKAASIKSSVVIFISTLPSYQSIRIESQNRPVLHPPQVKNGNIANQHRKNNISRNKPKDF